MYGTSQYVSYTIIIGDVKKIKGIVIILLQWDKNPDNIQNTLNMYPKGKYNSRDTPTEKY